MKTATAVQNKKEEIVLEVNENLLNQHLQRYNDAKQSLQRTVESFATLEVGTISGIEQIAELLSRGANDFLQDVLTKNVNEKPELAAFKNLKPESLLSSWNLPTIEQFCQSVIESKQAMNGLDLKYFTFDNGAVGLSEKELKEYLIDRFTWKLTSPLDIEYYTLHTQAAKALTDFLQFSKRTGNALDLTSWGTFPAAFEYLQNEPGHVIGFKPRLRISAPW